MRGRFSWIVIGISMITGIQSCGDPGKEEPRSIEFRITKEQIAKLEANQPKSAHAPAQLGEAGDYWLFAGTISADDIDPALEADKTFPILEDGTPEGLDSDDDFIIVIAGVPPGSGRTAGLEWSLSLVSIDFPLTVIWEGSTENVTVTANEITTVEVDMNCVDVTCQ